jgi:GNAT superfamily N-acetyltransferase
LPTLGYEATEAQIVSRFAALSERPDHEIWVAELDAAVVGMAHVYGVQLMASDGYAEIGALVVSSKHQRHGIGKQLIAASESWAIAQGYRRVRLRSGLHRAEAHLFYEAAGYAKARASFAFERCF